MRRTTASHVRVALACTATAWLSVAADAEVTTYTDRDAFEAAVAALEPRASLDFDTLAGGTLISSGTTVGDFTFSYAIAGADLVVVNAFPTTSGANSLGATGEDQALLASDVFDLEFPAATAIGLYVISVDMLAGDVELATPAGAVAIATPEQVLGDGADVFFVGLVESEPSGAFTTAQVKSFAIEAVGDFAWNVDDLVTAPEPNAALAAAAVALLVLLRRRRS